MRAAVWGAIAGAAPDLDILMGLSGDSFDQLIAHRGITHSLLFAPVVGPLWGWLLDRRERARLNRARDPGRLAAWIGVVTLALWSHPLLDLMTPYGTQLLAPLSRERFALSVMPIIDPLYTALLLVGLGCAWRFRRTAWGYRATWMGLLLSCVYIGYAAYLNEDARRTAIDQLRAAGIDDAEVHAYPTVLQIHYRRLVARSPALDRVGYLSTWAPCLIDWGSAPRLRDPRIDHLRNERAGRVFDWFAMGMTHPVITSRGDGTVTVDLADLRYGFDTNPARSIFSVSQPFDAVGRPDGPAILGTYRPSRRDADLIARLLSAYAACVVPGAVAS